MPYNRLKIAYFIDRLICGGTELQLVEQINQLAKKRVEQELFCLYKSAEHDSIPVSCKVNILNIRKLISANCLRAIYSLVIYLRANKFSLAQTYFFDSTVIGILAARMAGGIKTISCRRDLGFWHTPALLFILKMIDKITDRILVNAEVVKQSVIEKERLSPQRIDVIPNGLTTSQFKYSEEEKKQNRAEFGIKIDDVCVGTVANMSRKVKRVDVFVSAAQLVLQRTQNVKFLILGEGALRDELVQMARQLRIETNLVFLRSNISKHKVLSAMDIGISTSDSEGFSNAIMEYMAAGLPVVATAVGGNKDLLKNNEMGFLVKPGDFQVLAERILELISDKTKRSAFGERGREFIMPFDWKNITEMTYKYYEDQLRP
jgi:glycosyltransferase involved in cell wall biosynthesis